MEIINNYLKELIYLSLIVLVSVLSYFMAKRYILSIVKNVVKTQQNNWNEVFYEQQIFHYLIYLTPVPILYLGSFLFPFFQAKLEKGILVYIALVLILLSVKVLSVLLLIYNSYEISKKRPINTFVQ